MLVDEHNNNKYWMVLPDGAVRVGHNWVTSLSFSCIGEGNGNPLQCSCLENPRDSGAWWTFIYAVAQSQTQLRWFNSSSCQSSSCSTFIQLDSFYWAPCCSLCGHKVSDTTYQLNNNKMYVFQGSWNMLPNDFPAFLAGIHKAIWAQLTHSESYYCRIIFYL